MFFLIFVIVMLPKIYTAFRDIFGKIFVFNGGFSKTKSVCYQDLVMLSKVDTASCFFVLPGAKIIRLFFW